MRLIAMRSTVHRDCRVGSLVDIGSATVLPLVKFESPAGPAARGADAHHYADDCRARPSRLDRGPPARNVTQRKRPQPWGKCCRQHQQRQQCWTNGNASPTRTQLSGSDARSTEAETDQTSEHRHQRQQFVATRRPLNPHKSGPQDCRGPAAHHNRHDRRLPRGPRRTSVLRGQGPHNSCRGNSLKGFTR